MSTSRDQGDWQVHRTHLKQGGEFIFVEPTEFSALIVSRRRLIRADESKAKLCGLLDPESGQRYVVERERLLDLA
jgi:hypothetical protein